MTPEQLRDKLTSLTTQTTGLIDVAGWQEGRGGVETESCSDGRVKFGYSYEAPPQSATRDRAADAKAVAELWKSQGLKTETKGEPDALVVYATGEDIASVSFATGPGMYSVSGTTRCVTGNVDDLKGH